MLRIYRHTGSDKLRHHLREMVEHRIIYLRLVMAPPVLTYHPGWIQHARASESARASTDEGNHLLGKLETLFGYVKEIFPVQRTIAVQYLIDVTLRFQPLP